MSSVSTLVTPPAEEPLTLSEAKLRAGFDWIDGDPRDAMLRNHIAAARMKVEQDTGLALLTQTHDVWLQSGWASLELPGQCVPLQSVTTVEQENPDGTFDVLDASQYALDLARGRVSFVSGGYWRVRVVSGYASMALVPALLVHAVGLLTAHYATIGRDLTTVGTIIATTPLGYEEAIAPYRRMSLA